MKPFRSLLVVISVTASMSSSLFVGRAAAVEPPAIQYCRAQAQGAELSPGASAGNIPVIIEFSGSGQCTAGTRVTNITAQIHYYDTAGNEIPAGQTSCNPPVIRGTDETGFVAEVDCQLIGLPASAFYNRMYKVDTTLSFNHLVQGGSRVNSVTTTSYRFFMYQVLPGNNTGDATGSRETSESGAFASTPGRTVTFEASAVCGPLLEISGMTPADDAITARLFRWSGSAWVQVASSATLDAALCAQELDPGTGVALIRCTINAPSLPSGVLYRVLSGVGYYFQPRLGLDKFSSNGNNYYFMG